MKITPELVPASAANSQSGRALGPALIDCMPLMALVGAIIGGLYFGLVTPTEAAGVGVSEPCSRPPLRPARWQGFREALRGTVVVNAVVMFIIINSQVLSFALTTSGMGGGVSSWITTLHLAPFMFFVVLFCLYLLLGMFIDGISMMLLTIPVLYPSILAAGFDGVLFGVLLVLFTELGQLTPPMGTQPLRRSVDLGGGRRSRPSRGRPSPTPLISVPCTLCRHGIWASMPISSARNTL